MPSSAGTVVLLLQLHFVLTVDWEHLAEIQTAGEAAVITVGMLEAVNAVPEISRYLEDHPDYAAELPALGKNLVTLANKIMGHHLDHDVEKILLYFTVAYELHTYDFPVYVGPGTDQDTEEIRAVFRMLNHQSAAVPEDPKEGGELLTLSLAFARHLQVLSLVAKGMTIPYDDELLNEVRHKNAQFRLVFRLPHQMHFSDKDRKIIIDHMKMNIETIRRGVEEGTHPSSWLESIQEATKRILDRQKTDKDHVEL